MTASSRRWRRSEACLLALELALGLVVRAPGEHRLGEDVVEDLVADVAALLERAQDPPVGERRQHGTELVHGHASEVGEVRELVRDLRSRRRDEVVEEPRRDVLLLGRKRVHGALEVLLDDVLRAAEALERRHAEDVRARPRAPPPRGAA